MAQPPQQQPAPGFETRLTLTVDHGEESCSGCDKLVGKVVSTMPPEQVGGFGQDVPMRRPGQPKEVATLFVFLASEDSSYVAGALRGDGRNAGSVG